MSRSTPAHTMTPLERRASLSLALVFAMRMLGLFLVLPVFALEAARYPGGDDPALVGLAMGIYGLTQALLQIPLGMASDRFGRKRVIVLGFVVFAAGSLLAALADTLWWVMVGRALQGAGAVSAAVTALLADQTRDAVRTKAMAMVGASIGLMFALSLVAAPLLAALAGLPGLFALTGLLALACIAVVAWWTPPEPALHRSGPAGRLRDVIWHPALLRLNLGVFVLHAVQLAMWVAVPALLVRAGLAKADHWQVYLPAVLGSFVLMGATLFPLERRGHLRAVFLVAIGLIGLVQLALMWLADGAGLLTLGVLLFVFFCGFNVLEASQPSMASRVAPPQARGAALGLYNTLQSAGFFAGGALGGWLAKTAGTSGLFAGCAALMLLWLVLAWPMQVPQSRRGRAGQRGAGDIINPLPEENTTMASVNKVILVGNCGRDPEIRYLPSGQAVANISVATSSRRKDKTSGEMVEDTQWHRVTFFDRLAEIVGEYVKKGRPIYVEGRLSYRKYTDKDGIEKSATDIIATELQLLGGREGMGGPAGDDEATVPRRAPAAAPRAPAPAPRQAPAKSSSGFDDMDDDIPF